MFNNVLICLVSRTTIDIASATSGIGDNAAWIGNNSAEIGDNAGIFDIAAKMIPC